MDPNNMFPFKKISIQKNFLLAEGPALRLRLAEPRERLRRSKAGAAKPPIVAREKIHNPPP